MIAPSGIPEAIPLAKADDIGRHAKMLAGEHLAGAAHARLDLIRDI
jgi:hypothetical protein